MTEKGKKFISDLCSYHFGNSEVAKKEVLDALVSRAKGLKSADEVYEALGYLINANPAGMIESKRLLCRLLHTYANYEQLLEECEKNGTAIKESKDFYEHSILTTLERVIEASLYKGLGELTS